MSQSRPHALQDHERLAFRYPTIRVDCRLVGVFMSQLPLEGLVAISHLRSPDRAGWPVVLIGSSVREIYLIRFGYDAFSGAGSRSS